MHEPFDFVPKAIRTEVHEKKGYNLGIRTERSVPWTEVTYGTETSRKSFRLPRSKKEQPPVAIEPFAQDPARYVELMERSKITSWAFGPDLRESKSKDILVPIVVQLFLPPCKRAGIKK